MLTLAFANLPFPVRQYAVEPRSGTHRCRGCGTWFTPKPLAAGHFCGVRCYRDPLRPTRSQNAAVPDWFGRRSLSGVGLL